MKEVLTNKQIEHETIVDRDELVQLYLESLTVRELKTILLDRSIECNDCVERSELLDRVKLKCF